MSLSGHFGHFYICDHSGQLNDFFWGTPSSRCQSGSHQECQQFPLFPMENSYEAPPWLRRKERSDAALPNPALKLTVLLSNLDFGAPSLILVLE